MANEHVKSILSLTRQQYRDEVDAWRQNEIRFQATRKAYDELRAFQWEDNAMLADVTTSHGRAQNPGLASYEARKRSAVLIKFGQMVSERFGGLLFQHFPAEDAGLDLGHLRARDEGVRAEMLLENADGIGSSARSFEAFWRDAYEASLATNVRWIFVEASEEPASTLADEIDGARPYLIEYSPTVVPYWRFRRGVLECLRIDLSESRLKIDNGHVVEEDVTLHYLMTHEGFKDWGTSEEAGPGFTFDLGGWWIVDDDGEIVVDERGPRMGDWSKTGGQIPMTLLFYERGEVGDGRCAMEDIGRIQLEFMNQLSALFYDAWTGGSGVVFFAGADPEQWKVVRDGGLSGGKWIPIPPSRSDTGSPANVSIQPISAFDASAAIEKALGWLLKLATELIIRELTTAPNASGASRQLEFLQGNTPRLSDNAANMEEAMRNTLRFLEMRWGFPAIASVKWTRHFDLRTTLQKIRDVFEALGEVGGHSPTLVSELIIAALKSEGLLSSESDELEDQIRADLSAPLERQRAETQRIQTSIEADRQIQRDTARRAEQIETAANGQT